MDEADFKQRVKRLLEVDQIISKLDPAIRAPAFETLRSFVTGEKPDPARKKVDNSDLGDLESDRGSGTGVNEAKARLLAEHPDAKPGENTLIAAAVWFEAYGTAPFSIDGLRAVAKEMGITLPDRPDATVAVATRDKKKLFRRLAKGSYAPTVHGQSFMKNEYSVKQGQESPPTSP